MADKERRKKAAKEYLDRPGQINIANVMAAISEATDQSLEESEEAGAEAERAMVASMPEETFTPGSAFGTPKLPDPGPFKPHAGFLPGAAPPPPAGAASGGPPVALATGVGEDIATKTAGLGKVAPGGPAATAAAAGPAQEPWADYPGVRRAGTPAKWGRTGQVTTRTMPVPDPTVVAEMLQAREEKESAQGTAAFHRAVAADEAKSATAQYQEEAKGIREDELKQMEAISAQFEKRIGQEQAAIEKINADIASGKVDVKKIWNDATGFKTALAGFFAGLASGILRRPDTFLADLKQRVQMEVDAEEANLARMGTERAARMSMLGALRKVYWDDPMKAREAAMAIKLGAAENELAQSMGLAKTAEQQAQLAEAKAGIAAERQEHMGKLLEITMGKAATQMQEAYRGGSPGVYKTPKQQWWENLTPAEKAGEIEAAKVKARKGPSGGVDKEGMLEATKRLTQTELVPYKMALNELNRRIEEAHEAGVDPLGWLTGTARGFELEGPGVGEFKPFRGLQEALSDPHTNRVYQAFDRVLATAIKRGGGKALTPSEQTLFRAFTQGTGTKAAVMQGIEMASNEVDGLMAIQLAPWSSTPEGRSGVVDPLVNTYPGIYGGLPRHMQLEQ